MRNPQYTQNNSLVMPSKPFLMQLTSTPNIGAVEWFMDFMNTQNIINKDLNKYCNNALNVQQRLFNEGKFETNVK
jgi:hypothetical protein